MEPADRVNSALSEAGAKCHTVPVAKNYASFGQAPTGSIGCQRMGIAMAMIIDLHEAMSRHGPLTARAPSGAEAEIVFFPGIRYERREVAHNVEAEVQPTQRDKLELPEE